MYERMLTVQMKTRGVAHATGPQEGAGAVQVDDGQGETHGRTLWVTRLGQGGYDGSGTHDQLAREMRRLQTTIMSAALSMWDQRVEIVGGSVSKEALEQLRGTLRRAVLEKFADVPPVAGRDEHLLGLPIK
eukprot:7407189-Pyramimonas_sp.AAC.1